MTPRSIHLHDMAGIPLRQALAIVEQTAEATVPLGPTIRFRSGDREIVVRVRTRPESRSLTLRIEKA